MPAVLIGAEPIRHRPGPFRDLLEAAGFTPLDPGVAGKLSEADLIRWLPACDAVIAGGEGYTARVIASAPDLRVISRTGVGYDDVDVRAATDRGIAVTITPGANHEGVAEQTFALLLALVKDLIEQDRSIQAGAWDRRKLPRPLRGMTLGLVGLGRIGRAVAQLGFAFGMRILAFDPIEDPGHDARMGILRVSLDDLLAGSDVVSLHLPLRPETRGLFDRAAFARMRPGSLLINTSRGGLIVEDELVEALQSGRIAGAGLDVFATEPPAADHPLRTLPNVIRTAHLAGVDERSMADMATMAARNVIDLFEGRWPGESVINPEVRSAWGR